MAQGRNCLIFCSVDERMRQNCPKCTTRICWK